MSKKDKGKNGKGKSKDEKAVLAKIPDEVEDGPELEIKRAVVTGVNEKNILVDKKEYFQELCRLQIELVKLQEWVRFKGLKVIVLFEGRDAAGKGGVIKRIDRKSVV